MNKRVLKPLLVSWFVLFFGAVVIFNGCIAKFDPIALEKATSLKTLSLQVMDKAVESYADHEAEVDGLMLVLDQAYEYANSKARNKPSARQWKILKDPERDLLGGFLKRWKEKDSLNGPFITEAKMQVAMAFDMIIDLENGKNH